MDREERLRKRRERDKARREAETPALLKICSTIDTPTWSLLEFQRSDHYSNAHLKSLAYEQRAHWHHAPRTYEIGE